MNHRDSIAAAPADTARAAALQILAGMNPADSKTVNVYSMMKSSLSGSATWIHMVRAFHHIYGMPVGERLWRDTNCQHMTRDRIKMRLGLILEEVLELFSACSFELVDNQLNDGGNELTLRDDVLFKTGSPLNSGGVDTVEAADALGDIIYVVLGMAIEMGIDLDSVLREIHASNLTKLGYDGHPIYREDGKVMKGPNYVRPNIARALGFIRGGI